MKYFVRFLSLCLGVLLFHSCLQEENDLSPTPTGISQSPAVLKARAAFEDYASQDIDYQISGLHRMYFAQMGGSKVILAT